MNTAVARWCVLIPCLNEEAAIQSVVESVLALGAPVIVIDDGSDDRTPEIVATLPVTLLRHTERRGKGEALRHGFREALRQGYDAVLTMDGDGQHLASDIPRIVAAAAHYPRAHRDRRAPARSRTAAEGPPPRQRGRRLGHLVGVRASRSPTPRAASAGIRARHWIWSTCRRRTSCSRRRS